MSIIRCPRHAAVHRNHAGHTENSSFTTIDNISGRGSSLRVGPGRYHSTQIALRIGQLTRAEVRCAKTYLTRRCPLWVECGQSVTTVLSVSTSEQIHPSEFPEKHRGAYGQLEPICLHEAGRTVVVSPIARKLRNRRREDGLAEAFEDGGTRAGAPAPRSPASATLHLRHDPLLLGEGAEEFPPLQGSWGYAFSAPRIRSSRPLRPSGTTPVDEVNSIPARLPRSTGGHGTRLIRIQVRFPACTQSPPCRSPCRA